jgi:hypothetical protein
MVVVVVAIVVVAVRIDLVTIIVTLMVQVVRRTEETCAIIVRVKTELETVIIRCQCREVVRIAYEAREEVGAEALMVNEGVEAALVEVIGRVVVFLVNVVVLVKEVAVVEEEVNYPFHKTLFPL